MSYDSPYTWDDSAESSYTNTIPSGLEHISPEVKRVLVLGCGTARGFLAFAETRPDVEFVLVDVRVDYIEEIAQNAPQNVSAHALHFMQLPFMKDQFGEFDLIHCWGVLGFLDETTLASLWSIFRHFSSAQGCVFISYDNALFTYAWEHLRNASIALCKLYGEKHDSDRLISMLKAMFQDDDAFEWALHELETKPHLFRHTIFQPVYQPLWTFDVARKMSEAGYEFVPRSAQAPSDDLFRQRANGEEEEAYRVELWRKKS